MTAKSVLMRQKGLCQRARAPTCPPCYASGVQTSNPSLVATPLVQIIIALLGGGEKRPKNKYPHRANNYVVLKTCYNLLSQLCVQVKGSIFPIKITKSIMLQKYQQFQMYTCMTFNPTL